MSRILVTGGAGFIGANACNILAAKGFDVVAMDDLRLGDRNNLNSAVHFIEGDVANAQELDRVGPVDYVIHLAASSSSPMFVSELTQSFTNNVRGHLCALEFARRAGVKKVLFASTSSIYGDSPVPLAETQPVKPPNFYSISKQCQEQISELYSRSYGMEIIGFRFMSVYGPCEEHKGKFANLVSQFVWGMESNKPPVIYGDGRQTRDFTNVRDVVKAFLLAIESTKKFGFAVFNVGTAEAVDLTALVTLINRLMGTVTEPRYVPNPIREYVLSQQADLSKISRELGYQADITLEHGIKELLSYRKLNRRAPASLSF